MIAIKTMESYGLNCFREFAIVVDHFISLDDYLDGAITTDVDDIKPAFVVLETSFRTARAFEDLDVQLIQIDYLGSWHLGCSDYCPYL